jgi:hypothetical protein
MCSQWTPIVEIKYFMFDWTIYSPFVLNTGWKYGSLQMMISVNICSTWSMVEIKTRFETRIRRKDVNGVSLFDLSYLINLMAYLCSQTTPNVQVMYFIFDFSIYRLFVLNLAWKRDSLQMTIFVTGWSIWSMVELKTRFETSITRNDVNGESVFLIYYIITLMAFLCSQLTPNVQVKHFMIDWSIYIIFVLNSAWKRDSLQMTIFVTGCSIWSMVEIKTRFETWITRNDDKGVSLFHLSYLITRMSYLSSKWTPSVQINYVWLVDLRTICPKYGLETSFQMMIFVYVCWTWGKVELKRVFRRE